MTGFDTFEDFEADNSAITMFDDDGNEVRYQILATKDDSVGAGGCMFMLAEEVFDTPDEDLAAEVLIFKCVAESQEDDEMIFELVEDDHEDFDKAFLLFKDDLEALGIEY